MAETLVTSGVQPDPAVVARAVSALRGGALVIYPTDTLYALGGRAEDPEVPRRVAQAKGRPDGKPLPVIAGDLAQARALCAAFPAAALRLAGAFWPGPLTLVLRARPDLPAGVTEDTGTVAVRVPALALARALCASAGPLVSTSANRSGEPAPATCREAVAAVGVAAALALDAGPGRPLPSTIVSLTGDEPALVRTGAVPWADVVAALQAGG